MVRPMAKPVCAVVGIGPGNGAAFARRFAADGYAVALLARSPGLSRELAAELPGARAWECDVGDAASVQRAFDAIRGELGDPEVAIFNAGSGLFGSFDDVTADDFEASWRVNALGMFLDAKQVVPAMQRPGRGNFVVIGATASRPALRGGARDPQREFPPAQGGAALAGRVDGPNSRAGLHPCLADRDRRRG